MTAIRIRTIVVPTAEYEQLLWHKQDHLAMCGRLHDAAMKYDLLTGEHGYVDQAIINELHRAKEALGTGQGYAEGSTARMEDKSVEWRKIPTEIIGEAK